MKNYNKIWYVNESQWKIKVRMANSLNDIKFNSFPVYYVALKINKCY